MVQLSIGGAIGAHTSEVEQRVTLLGVTVTETETDGVASVTFPFQVGYNISPRFALGLNIELGKYIPDSATSQTNSLGLVFLEPRFYILNGNRLAWHANLQLGGSGLHQVDDTPGDKADARWSGAAVGLGTGMGLGLGRVLGLGLDLRYVTTTQELRAMEINDASVMDFFGATLRTSGIVFQLSASVRFGGD